MINIKGKNYVTVAERVAMAHEKRADFQIMESSPIQLGERVLWKVIIEIAGKQFIGHAEAKLNAAKNLPDGTNPFECAETSAIGRALGFAGLGSVESIASAEEVIMAQREQERDENGPATLQQLDTIKKLQRAAGLSEMDLDGITWNDAATMLRSLQKRPQTATR